MNGYSTNWKDALLIQSTNSRSYHLFPIDIANLQYFDSGSAKEDKLAQWEQLRQRLLSEKARELHTDPRPHG
jgi:hypothetical protein